MYRSEGNAATPLCKTFSAGVAPCRRGPSAFSAVSVHCCTARTRSDTTNSGNIATLTAPASFAVAIIGQCLSIQSAAAFRAFPRQVLATSATTLTRRCASAAASAGVAKGPIKHKGYATSLFARSPHHRRRSVTGAAGCFIKNGLVAIPPRTDRCT